MKLYMSYRDTEHTDTEEVTGVNTHPLRHSPITKERGLVFCATFEGDASGHELTGFSVRDVQESSLSFHEPCMLSSFPKLAEALDKKADLISSYFAGYGCGGCAHNRYGRGQCEKNTHISGALPHDLICEKRKEVAQ